MKRLVYILVALCSPIFVFSQDITGLWRGTMYNDSTQQSLQYEIVITKEKGKYTAFSHTSFVADGKKYYGIKKINVRVAKDGKIIMQDSKLVEENYPVLRNKNVFQLNVLDLANSGDDATLNGLFVTNGSKEYRELTGRIDIKKVNPETPSDLVQYLQKNSGENILTVAKAEK